MQGREESDSLLVCSFMRGLSPASRLQRTVVLTKEAGQDHSGHLVSPLQAMMGEQSSLPALWRLWKA